ncbi:hypothetical protein [Nannocystis sp.]|uniref:hypothetical protein n=1 Tax=Nannocystis sp. TaxID=1962667 RepID=UPI00344B8C42
MAGVAGPQGPSGIVSTGKFSGAIGAVAANGVAFVFVGGTPTVSFTAIERITGAATTALVASAAGSFKVDLCYKNGANPIVNFAGGGATTQVSIAAGVRAPVGAVGTVVPGFAGVNVTVGFCVDTDTSGINASDIVNGWMQVTN